MPSLAHKKNENTHPNLIGFRLILIESGNPGVQSAHWALHRAPSHIMVWFRFEQVRPDLELTTSVLDLALTLGTHNHGIVVGFRAGTHKLKVEVTQEI